MTTIDEQVQDFLAQKRIAIAGVSHDHSRHPDVGSIPGGVDGVVIITRPDATERVVHDCAAAGVSRVWMHQSFSKSQTSVSQSAVEYCREHGIGVIAGACPMTPAQHKLRCTSWR